MSVGGNIIEIRPQRITMGVPPRTEEVVRIWCMDPHNGDETCVYARPADVMPKLGDAVWWTSGRILFDGDRRSLEKVGFSFRPPVNGSRTRPEGKR